MMELASTTNPRPVIHTPGAEDLLAAAAAEIATGVDGRRLARLLADRAASLDLAHARAATLEAGRSVALAQRAEDLVLALRWFAPGQPTAIHDHGAWGALVVLEGDERYERYERTTEHEAELQATHYLRAGDTLWWSPPPGDVHLQEGGSAGALDLILLGTNPDVAPTANYSRASTWAHPVDGVSELISAVHAAYLGGDAAPLAAWYADDALAEICVPAWRFQLQGRQNILNLIAAEEYGLPGYRLAMFRALPTADGAVVETEVQFVEDAEQRLLRDLHVLRQRVLDTVG